MTSGLCVMRDKRSIWIPLYPSPNGLTRLQEAGKAQAGLEPRVMVWVLTSADGVLADAFVQGHDVG